MFTIEILATEGRGKNKTKFGKRFKCTQKSQSKLNLNGFWEMKTSFVFWFYSRICCCFLLAISIFFFFSFDKYITNDERWEHVTYSNKIPKRLLSTWNGDAIFVYVMTDYDDFICSSIWNSSVDSMHSSLLSEQKMMLYCSSCRSSVLSFSLQFAQS